MMVGLFFWWLTVKKENVNAATVDSLNDDDDGKKEIVERCGELLENRCYVWIMY